MLFVDGVYLPAAGGPPVFRHLPAPNGAFVATPVVDPAVLLQELADDVVGVGPGQSLYRKVELAQAYLAANDIPATCAMLMDFINEVGAQRDKKIPAASADQLIADAQAIMTEIGCH
jgi:hypothetical protein